MATELAALRAAQTITNSSAILAHWESGELRRLHRDLATAVAEALRTNGILLFPPRKPQANVRAEHWGLLTNGEIRAIPLLNEVRKRLPKTLRIVVATWPDHTAVVALAPKIAPRPPEWWFEHVFADARKAPHV